MLPLQLWRTNSPRHAQTALTYGKIIINEKYLPVRHKTIKPSTELGGVLGGEKYVVHRMLFKVRARSFFC